MPGRNSWLDAGVNSLSYTAGPKARPGSIISNPPPLSGPAAKTPAVKPLATGAAPLKPPASSGVIGDAIGPMRPSPARSTGVGVAPAAAGGALMGGIKSLRDTSAALSANPPQRGQRPRPDVAPVVNIPFLGPQALRTNPSPYGTGMWLDPVTQAAPLPAQLPPKAPSTPVQAPAPSLGVNSPRTWGQWAWDMGHTPLSRMFGMDPAGRPATAIGRGLNNLPIIGKNNTPGPAWDAETLMNQGVIPAVRQAVGEVPGAVVNTALSAPGRAWRGAKSLFMGAP